MVPGWSGGRVQKREKGVPKEVLEARGAETLLPWAVIADRINLLVRACYGP